MPVALDQPELVVVAGAGIVRVGIRDVVEDGEDEAVAELRVAVVLGDLRRELLQLGDFRVGEPLFAFPLLRALQRRHGVVRPDALKVRMPVGVPALLRISKPSTGLPAPREINTLAPPGPSLGNALCPRRSSARCQTATALRTGGPASRRNIERNPLAGSPTRKSAEEQHRQYDPRRA